MTTRTDDPAIYIVTPSRVGGLSRDVEILVEVFLSLNPNRSVHVVDATPPRPGDDYWHLLSDKVVLRRSDLWIFLEVVVDVVVSPARSVLIPNPEWYNSRWNSRLHYFDAIWAKTAQACVVLADLHQSVRYIGFSTPRALYSADLASGFFYCNSGKSPLRQDGALVSAWERLGGPAPLTIVSNMPISSGTPNLTSIRPEYPPSLAHMESISNATFQFCLSRAEGWGHYAVEALWAGAIVIYGSCPPFDDTLANSGGISVQMYPTDERLGLSALWSIDPVDLVSAIREAIALTPIERASRSIMAIERAAAIHQQFRDRLKAALYQLLR